MKMKLRLNEPTFALYTPNVTLIGPGGIWSGPAKTNFFKNFGKKSRPFGAYPLTNSRDVIKIYVFVSVVLFHLRHLVAFAQQVKREASKLGITVSA